MSNYFRKNRNDSNESQQPQQKQEQRQPRIDRKRIHRDVVLHRTFPIIHGTDEILRSYEERPLECLPALAKDLLLYQNDETYLLQQSHTKTTTTRMMKYGWEPSLQTILKGTRDDMNQPPISILRSYEDTIIQYIFSFLSHPWSSHVKLTVPAALVGTYLSRTRLRFGTRNSSPASYNRISSGFDDGFVSYSTVGKVIFPKPNDRNVNMLPFIFGNKRSLPKNLQDYFDLIEACPYHNKSERGKVGYLTVHESYVDAGQTQRRPGLHIESPGFIRNTNDDDDDDDDDGTTKHDKKRKKGTKKSHTSFLGAIEHGWGLGIFFGQDRYEGGIYMASNIADTCQIWDALIDNRTSGIVNEHGECEHLRTILGKGISLNANELIVHRTRALPQVQEGGCRSIIFSVSCGSEYIPLVRRNISTGKSKRFRCRNHVKICKRVTNFIVEKEKEEEEVVKRSETKYGNDVADDGASRKRSGWSERVRTLYSHVVEESTAVGNNNNNNNKK